jgi:AmiR/NasT family two-component response regulator
LIEDMLDNAGYAVVGPIASAGAAVESLDMQPIDLVALDVDEIRDSEIEKLHEALTDQSVPCIAIGSPSRLAQIKAGAFASLIAKPIDRDLLLRAVCSTLEEDDLDIDDAMTES